VTVVTGLETVPELKIKDAAKLFGKKFSSGASIGETPTGAKEVVIQGDVLFSLPPLLVSEYKVCCLFIIFLYITINLLFQFSSLDSRIHNIL